MRSLETVDTEETWTQAVDAHQAGDLVRARALYEEVLRAQPQQADALHMLGLIAQQSGDLARARALLEESVGICPDFSRTHYDLAKVRAAQGAFDDAILAYEAAVRFAPDFAEAHSNLGGLYLQNGRHDDALRAYGNALRAQPDLAAVHCNLATVFIDLKRHDEALAALTTAQRLAPDLPNVQASLYRSYRRLGREREAIAAALRAVELEPNANDYLNLGVVALELDALDIALLANRRALEFDATNATTHSNLGWVYHRMGLYAQAIAAGEKAVSLEPQVASTHVNLALSLLTCGDFARGWNEYPWMWRIPERRAQYPYLDRAALWNGEPFAGRRLLITRDQGFGDAIQMVRYLPAIKALGGHVILELDPALVSIFEDVAGVDEVRVRANSDVAEPDVALDFDLQIPLLGIPHALRTDLSSIPAPIPYLRANEARVERWRSRLERPSRMRVGIAWAGNARHANDRRRSVQLEDFAPLGDIPGIEWFGLQKDRDEARAVCGSLTLDPLGAEIGDFTDTAAILTHLDLVIAVDTSVVHLAGALGKPVWTLLPFAPDWRWLLARSDSPWYPTMRLFRQPRDGDWPSVFGEVARELRALTLTF